MNVEQCGLLKQRIDLEDSRDEVFFNLFMKMSLLID